MSDSYGGQPAAPNTMQDLTRITSALQNLVIAVNNMTQTLHSINTVLDQINATIEAHP